MYVHTIDQFITAGTGNIPEGNWVAAAIHASSEVDVCIIDGKVIGAGRGIVPIAGGGKPVVAVRSVNAGGTALSSLTLLQAPSDNVTAPGEKLALILWEACDDIEAPVARAPLLRQVTVKPVPQTQATAQLAMRIPFSGRSLCVLGFTASNQDAQVVVTGIRYPMPPKVGGSSGGFQFVESAIQTVPSGTTLATGPNATTVGASKVIYFTEAFDELCVFVWCPGGANGSVLVEAEISGERLL